MKSKKGILPKGYVVNENYSIAFFLKKGSYAESYRVKTLDGKTKFLKLFAYAKLHKTQFDPEGNILEIEILKKTNHPNIVKYREHGNIIFEHQKYAYIVLDFISGETLADKMKRDEVFNPYEAKDIILGVLNGLNYLHNLPVPVIHNEITNLNVMIDLSGKVSVSKIIDFGYARYLNQSNKDFYIEGLNPFYLAPETFNKVFSPRSDVFAVGALYFHLLFGLPPWFVELSKFKTNRNALEEANSNERKKPLRILDKENGLDEKTKSIIIKALQPIAENRFKSVSEFIQTLNGELQLSNPIEPSSIPQKQVKKETLKGHGFDAVAGMKELKDMVQLDVIDALNDREKYAEYGLTIPNGMLLYGPPGCGKTFFAERMAEEIGFNFHQIKPSDIQSKWVNASQENIKTLFDEARENAPSIIFIDELDALVPNRNNTSINHMNSSAVNEFLAQMNNSGEDGIFLIGATNRPNSIDPAILRSGRLDKLIYLPPPDFEARKKMFKIHLEKRPKDIGLDYNQLANVTENYVSSDLKFIVDEAARAALKLKSRITQEILLDTIGKIKPSVSLSELNKYKAMSSKIKGEKSEENDKPQIGFHK